MIDQRHDDGNRGAYAIPEFEKGKRTSLGRHSTLPCSLFSS